MGTRRSGGNRLWRLLAVLLALALVAAACGDDDDGDGGASPTTTAGTDNGNGGEPDVELDPDGLLRIATQINNYSYEDLTTFGGPNQLNIGYHAFGTPLQLLPDGTLGPYLAESFEIVDANTVVLNLREGLTFQNGDPYDAEALREAFLERRATENQSFDINITNQVSEVQVDSETQVTFVLDAPIAGSFSLVLAKQAFYATVPGADGIPVGAGPYRIVDFTFEDKVVLEKWDDFFDADSYDVKTVEFLNIPAIEAAQSALEDNLVDLIATNPRDVTSLLERGPFESVVTNNEAFLMLATCKSTAPFDDADFRRAFDLAIDRERLNQVVLGGNALPMTSVWDPGSPFAMEQFLPTADQDEARQILEDIDWDESTEVPFGYFAGFQTHQLIAEVIQGQVQEVGINLNVVPIQPAAIAETVNAQTGGAYVIANSQPGVQKVVIPLLTPGSTWNPCDWDDPALRELTDAISAGNASQSELADLWAEAQEIVFDQNLYVPLMTQPAVYVYNTDRVVGVESGTIGLLGATTPAPYLEGMGIRA